MVAQIVIWKRAYGTPKSMLVSRKSPFLCYMALTGCTSSGFTCGKCGLHYTCEGCGNWRFGAPGCNWCKILKGGERQKCRTEKICSPALRSLLQIKHVKVDCNMEAIFPWGSYIESDEHELYWKPSESLILFPGGEMYWELPQVPDSHRGEEKVDHRHGRGESVRVGLHSCMSVHHIFAWETLDTGEYPRSPLTSWERFP